MSKLILFQSGGVQFAIEQTHVTDIQPGSALSSLPLKRQERQSVDYRGRTLKLIDLAASLNHETTPPSSSDAKMFMVNVDSRSSAAALWADKVYGVLDAEAGQLEVLPPVFTGTARAYFPNMLRIKGRLVLVLNTAAVVSGEPGQGASIQHQDHKSISKSVQASRPRRPELSKDSLNLIQHLVLKKLEALITQKTQRIVAERIQQALNETMTTALRPETPCVHN